MLLTPSLAVRSMNHQNSMSQENDDLHLRQPSSSCCLTCPVPQCPLLRSMLPQPNALFNCSAVVVFFLSSYPSLLKHSNGIVSLLVFEHWSGNSNTPIKNRILSRCEREEIYCEQCLYFLQNRNFTIILLKKL